MKREAFSIWHLAFRRNGLPSLISPSRGEVGCCDFPKCQMLNASYGVSHA